MLILSKDDIILLQGLRIKQLDEAIIELISVIARQYDQSTNLNAFVGPVIG